MAYEYARPIQSTEHAWWCLQEAARRYDGEVIQDNYGMLARIIQRGAVRPGDAAERDVVLRGVGDAGIAV
jgi:hypothetical protein